MSADRHEGHRADTDSRFSGRVRLRPNARAEGQPEGLRDAIAFLNRDSVALPTPETPPWESRPPQRPEPPLAPVRELRPGQHGGPQAGGTPVSGAPAGGTPVNDQPLPPPQSGQRFAGRMDNGPQFPIQREQQFPAPVRQDMERRGFATSPTAGANPEDGINAFADIDWPSVDLLRKQVRDRITEQFPHRDSGSEAQRRAFGMAVIEESVNSWYARSVSRGLALSDAQQQTMRRAVGASVFGMGRLTPMLEHSEIENIEYRGFDDGYVVYSDGRVEKAPPIADSDESMLADLQYWAAKQNRTLSPSTPHLYLTLEGGARLTATIGTSKRPNMVIRRHRVVDVTLDDLVARGMVSPSMAAFLRAAVLANTNIVVTGPLNSGKTTLLRALAAEIPQMERYATLETEYELHLDEVGRHPRMVAYQALVGTAEQGLNGRRAGEVTLTDIMEVALRMNFTRLIVGEIRGAEVVAMLEAVSTGGRGSLCTMHANSARDVFGRFVTLCTRTNMTRDSAVQLAAESLHYIVNVQMDADSATGLQNTRSARRFVDQIVEVNGMGDGMNPAATDVFSPGADGRGVFSHRPERLAKLQKAGFDPNWLLYGNDQWSVAGGAAAQDVTRAAPAQNAHQTVASPFQGGDFSGGGPSFGGHPTATSQRAMSDQDRFDRQYLQDRQRLDRQADYDRNGNFRADYERGRPNPDADARTDPRGGGRGHR